MGLENFIKHIKENVNEQEKWPSPNKEDLLKAVEAFKNKIISLSSVKDWEVFIPPTSGGKKSIASSATRLISSSTGILLTLAIYDFPWKNQIGLVTSNLNLGFISKPTFYQAFGGSFILNATYDKSTNSLIEFYFRHGDETSFKKAIESGKEKEYFKQSNVKQFFINLNFNKEDNSYNFSLTDGRSSAKTDLAGITQELRRLGISRIENVLGIVNSKGTTKFVVSPAILKQANISFK